MRMSLVGRWAGSVAVGVCGLLAGGARAQQVAITFDDLPAHGPLPPGVTRVEIIHDLVAALQASGLPPVYGFVNGVRVEEHAADETVLDVWRQAGYPLGNHTWSHMNLNEHTAAEWEADLLRNEPLLQKHMDGENWHWLRYPYLAEGNTPEKTAEVRTFLAGHGYRIAGVTMSFADYLFNEPYVRCVVKKDDAAVAALEAGYLKAAADDLSDRKAMSQAALGRSVPLVLLMHVGALDARMLPRLLAMYKAAGVTFVGLEQAESDPFYRNDVNPALPAFPDTLEAAVAQRKVTVARHASDADALNKLCR